MDASEKKNESVKYSIAPLYESTAGTLVRAWKIVDVRSALVPADGCILFFEDENGAYINAPVEWCYRNSPEIGSYFSFNAEFKTGPIKIEFARCYVKEIFEKEFIAVPEKKIPVSRSNTGKKNGKPTQADIELATRIGRHYAEGEFSEAHALVMNARLVAARSGREWAFDAVLAWEHDDGEKHPEGLAEYIDKKR
jgi:hypothetical protein